MSQNLFLMTLKLNICVIDSSLSQHCKTVLVPGNFNFNHLRDVLAGIFDQNNVCLSTSSTVNCFSQSVNTRKLNKYFYRVGQIFISDCDCGECIRYRIVLKAISPEIFPWGVMI